MAFYQRTSEGPMEFEYENSQILSFNSFLDNGTDSSLTQVNSLRNEPKTPQEPTAETSDLFLPKNYFNTNVHTALDRNMSDQLGGISLQENNNTTEASLDGKEHLGHNQKTTGSDQTPDSSSTTAIVPYDQSKSAPSTPSLSVSPKSSPTYSEDTNNNSNHSRNAAAHLKNEQNDVYGETNTMTSDQYQAYNPHLYPTFSYYHHDPVAHRKSLINYIAGIIRIGCQLILFSIGIYIGFRFVLALNDDVTSKIQVYESEYMEKYFICEQEYHQNQCQNNQRPAMVEPCREWLRCIYTPAWIGKTKVLAETFAEIANGFVDTISLKSMGFGILLIITTLVFSNQGKHTAGRHQQQYHPSPSPPTLAPSYFTQHLTPSHAHT